MIGINISVSRGVMQYILVDKWEAEVFPKHLFLTTTSHTALSKNSVLLRPNGFVFRRTQVFELNSNMIVQSVIY